MASPDTRNRGFGGIPQPVTFQERQLVLVLRAVTSRGAWTQPAHLPHSHPFMAVVSPGPGKLLALDGLVC